MNTDASNVEDMNIPQIIERLSMSRIASFREWSNIFRNRSFTLCRVPRGRSFLITLCGIERESSRHVLIFLAGFAQPRDVHRCNGSLLDSTKEGIENIAFMELFRRTRMTLHCPFHESSLADRHWMGCRRYFAASRLEVLLDEDDFRSSSQALELGDVLLLSQLHVTILAL